MTPLHVKPHALMLGFIRRAIVAFVLLRVEHIIQFAKLVVPVRGVIWK